jgi:hypothetical protein
MAQRSEAIGKGSADIACSDYADFHGSSFGFGKFTRQGVVFDASYGFAPGSL